MKKLSFVLLLGGCSSGLTELNKFDLNTMAAKDYLGLYQKDKNNKAFAVSPLVDGKNEGAFAAASGRKTIDEARSNALAECRSFLKKGDLDCIIYDINGSIVLTVPVRLPEVED